MLHAARESLHESIITSNKVKRTWPLPPSSNDDSIKENAPVNTPTVSSAGASKRMRLMNVSCTNSQHELAKMTQLLEKSYEREEQKDKRMEDFQAKLLEMQHKVIEIQEQTSATLLDIWKKGLLNNS